MGEMKINDVVITNFWLASGDYWEMVAGKPDEPLIEATIKLTASYNEYQALLKQNQPEQLEPEVRP